MSTTVYKEERGGEPLPLGEILEELLAQYEARFAEIHIKVVETQTA